MNETLLERAWAWIHATFPERQIYIRSEGRVQFFTFGPPLQATMAGLSLIFLGWVAFASVNVIFKDRIISAKDHRYQEMTSAYENRVADLQMSYDELNGALVSAEDRFKATADEFQAKQASIVKLLDRKRNMDATLVSLPGANIPMSPGADVSDDDATLAPSANGAASDSVGAVNVPAPNVTPDFKGGGNSELGISPQAAPAQPRTARPTRASFLDLGNAVEKLGALFHAPQSAGSSRVLNQPELRQLAYQELRVRHMSASENSLLIKTEDQLESRINGLQTVMRSAGIDPDNLERQVESQKGEGGPLIPITAVHIDGIADQAFTTAYTNALGQMQQLVELFSGVRHVPLTTPVHGAGYEITSGFGARIDPFTHRFSFHPGLDFAGPWGSTVMSTAPGVVDFAGPRGGYGNMVEIDHGFGIKTRYGHLSSILVTVGTKVGKGSAVGRLGSTGRSTGPHVHYEVVLETVQRDPSRFIEAGRHVLQ